MPQTLTSKRELWLLITLAGIPFTNILDFMFMMPLGPQFTALFHLSDVQFALLLSAYTLAVSPDCWPPPTSTDSGASACCWC